MPVIIFSPYIGTTSSGPAPVLVGLDPYFDNVIMLMHFDGANNGTVFPDTANNLLTVTGATTTTSNKKFGTASYNPATGYLTMPYQTFQPNSGVAFTIEMWVYPTGTSTASTCIGFGAADPVTTAVSWQFGLSAANKATMYTFSGTGNTLTGASTLALNTWTHIAFANNGGTATIYVNGVADVSGPFTNPSANTTNLVLGQVGGVKFAGLIDDLRITNGVARYTAAFTPSTIAFPDSFSVANYDPSYDAVAVLVNGESSLSTDVTGKVAFSTATVPLSTNKRFGTKSLAFAGSTATQLLSTTSTAWQVSGTITIEAWIYPTAITTIRHIVGANQTPPVGAPRIQIAANGIVQYITNVIRLTSIAAIPLNTWTHIAVSINAGMGTMYINGVPQGAPASIATTFTDVGLFIGSTGDGSSPFQGYIDEVRITKAARYNGAFTPVKQPSATKSVAMDMTYDPYAAYVIAQLRMEGANNGTSFVDDVGNVVTRVGSPVTSTAVTKFGTSSGKFNGTTDYLTLPSSANNAYGTGDFTMECWVYPTARAGVSVFFGQAAGSGASGISAYINGTGNVVVGNHTISYFSTATVVALNVWTHVAIVRIGTLLTCYINGAQAAQATNTTNMVDQLLWIGNSGETIYWFNGYIDDVRLTKGVGRYVGPFTPPASQLPSLSVSEYVTRYAATDTNAANVVFQMGFDGVVPTDTASKNVATTTAVTNQSAVFVEGGAGLFNGTTSMVVMPASANYAMGTGDFTMDCWVYPTARPSTQSILFGNYIAGATNTGGFISLNATGQMRFAANNGVFIANSTATVPLNLWSHLAVTRSGTNMYMFINGALVGTATGNSVNFTDNIVLVGSGSNTFFTGYIDNARLTKGVARYTTDFTPSVT